MPSPTGSTGDCREARREVCRQGAGTAGTTVNVCTASTTTTVVDSRSSNGGNARSSVSTSGRSVLRPASTSIAAAALVVSIGAAAASAASFSPSTSSAASSPAFCLPQPARVPPRAGQQQFRRKSSVAVAPGMRPNIHVAREVVIGGGGRAVSSLRCASGRAAGGRSREGAPPQGHGGRGATRLSSAVEHAGEAGVPAVMFATAATEKATGRGVSVTGSTRTRRKGVERSRDASAAAAAAGLGDGLGASSKLSGDPRATTAQQVRRRSREDSAYFGDSRGSARELEQQRGKLLTHDEEMELGTKVQRYLRLLEDKEHLEIPLGRPAELAEAIAASGLSRKQYNVVMMEGMAARQRLVVSNLALVVSLATKYKRGNVERCMETLIQEGTLGLIQASERYNPARGFRFATYAVWWIEAKLRLTIQTQERLIYVPMWVKNKYRVISRSLATLRESLGREPTSKELADQVLVDTNSKVKFTPERVDNIKTWMNVQASQVSLDNGLKFSTEARDDNFSRESSLAANEPSAEVTSDWEILRSFLESCMAQDLTCVQQKIVRMRVGLGGGKRNTRKEISRVLNMPVDTVAGEERKAFNKLGILRGHGEPPLSEFRDLR